MGERLTKRLTVKAIEGLKPRGKPYEVPDGGGLFLTVRPNGSMSFNLRYRFGGKARNLTLGPAALGLKEARNVAQEALVQIARGEDPCAQKNARRAAAREASEPTADSVEQVVEAFVDRYAKKKTRESSWRETERILNREVAAAWKGRRLGSITRADVHELLDKIVDRGAPVLANRTLAALRRLCNWAVERGIIEASPCDKVKAPAAETSRDRALSDEEIRLAWGAFESAGWPFGPLARLLLLTGARRDEIGSMRWSEVDLAEKLWTIPKERAKNGVEHQVPLSDTAVAILKSLPRIDGGKDAPGFVFTTTGKTPVSGFSRAKAQFDAAILEALQQAAAARGDDPETVEPLSRWTLHDLRRTAASGMAGLGIAPHVVEAALNHKSGTIKGVAAVYNRYSYAAEKRHALDAWARRVEAIVGGTAAGNVVELVMADA